jgi:hypothetical protein
MSAIVVMGLSPSGMRKNEKRKTKNGEPAVVALRRAQGERGRAVQVFAEAGADVGDGGHGAGLLSGNWELGTQEQRNDPFPLAERLVRVGC